MQERLKPEVLSAHSYIRSAYAAPSDCRSPHLVTPTFRQLTNTPVSSARSSRRQLSSTSKPPSNTGQLLNPDLAVSSAPPHHTTSLSTLSNHSALPALHTNLSVRCQSVVQKERREATATTRLVTTRLVTTGLFIEKYSKLHIRPKAITSDKR